MSSITTELLTQQKTVFGHTRQEVETGKLRGTLLQWIYNSMPFVTIRFPNTVPSSDPILVDGVEFTVSLLSTTSSDLVSEISFEVRRGINGGVLRCSGVNATAVEVVKSL